MTDRTSPNPTGPLRGLRVVEFAGIGPGPYAAMLLSDMGADVVRIDRPGAVPRPHDITARGRRVVNLDLKQPADMDAALRLLDGAEALIEGFRPGVMERLGLGPDVVLARNPKLVYGRMTGWGQDGPQSEFAGHDINYIAITGALAAIAPPGGKPVPPLNLVGDYGGGSLFLVMGVLAALLNARATGMGQVVDCAISDCVVNMLAPLHSMLASGAWQDRPASNLLDGAAHFYTTYECADGKHISVGAIEPQFYALLRERAGLSDSAFDEQRDQAAWPDLQARAATIFRTRTRDEWCAMLERSDACVAPVLSAGEAPTHSHLAARGSFVEVDGLRQPAPAPRFSATPSSAQGRAEACTVAAALLPLAGG
jgi:alpha-methylacyl-CoA racemase